MGAGSRFCIGCGTDVREVQAEVDTLDLDAGKSKRRIPRDEEVLHLLRAATRPEYEILGELGRGGMATVFLARELALDRKVAIKVLLPALLYGDGMVERFKREARTAGGLSHPHIIPIHAVRETPDLLYFVMKYVEGRPLDGVLKENGPLPIRMAQTILTQVASALYTAHRRQVIHRDIKSANIMLDEEGYAVVTDFGIAKVNTQANLTQTGAAVGTPYYMSPEQFVGQGVGPASDQYSLGVVGYEMFTGQVPFPARSLQDVMRAHLVELPRPLRELRPDCPPALERAVLRMLAKDAEDRHSSMEEVVRAIGTAPLDAAEVVKTQIIELARSGSQQRHRRVVKGPPGGPRPSSRRTGTEPQPAGTGASHGDAPRPPRGSSGQGRRSTPPSPSPVVPGHPTPPAGRPTLPHPRRRRRTVRLLLAIAGGVAAIAVGWLIVTVTVRDPGPAAGHGKAAGTDPPVQTGLAVASSLKGARLVLDGRDTLALDTAVTRFAVPAGTHLVSVIRPGCRAVTRTIRLEPGEVHPLGRLDPQCP